MKMCPIPRIPIQACLVALIISITKAHAAEEPVALNPHEYNTTADYGRWKLTTDSNGKEVGVWSDSGGTTAPEPPQQTSGRKHSIPPGVIAMVVIAAASGLTRLRR